MSAGNTYHHRQLFALVQQGDEQAFRQLFGEFAPKIHPFVLKIVKNREQAEELVQEVFLKVWINRQSLSTIENPSSWIYRIASNMAINFFRRQEVDRRALAEIGKNISEQSMTTVQEFNAKELQALIKEAVNQLPPQRKLIYQLIREEGLSRKEVAARLQLSENTVRNQVSISLQTIQQFIKKRSGYYIPLVLLIKNYF